MTFSLTDNPSEVNVINNLTLITAEVRKDNIPFPFETTFIDNNKIHVLLKPTQSSDLGVGKWPMAIVLQESEGYVRTYLQGYLVLTKRFL